MIIVGNIGIEMITCMLKNSVWAITVAICHTIDVISESAEQSAEQSAEESAEQSAEKSASAPTDILNCYMRNLSIQVRDLDRYVSSSKSILQIF